MQAIDVYGFAGGMTLGMRRSGLALVGKREKPAGFGVPLVLANARTLGLNPADVQCADPADWTPVGADIVFGNPPCSGFSNLSVSVRNKDGSKWVRGADAEINDCMRELVGFGAKCNPQAIAFESVQGAFKRGRPLMQALRAKLEVDTGARWHLTHVLHSAASVGGHAIRKRYFFVVSRVPFGVEPVRPLVVKTVNELIGDLERIPVGVRASKAWVTIPNVNGHWIVGGRPYREMLQLIELQGGYDRALPHGEGSAAGAKRLLAEGRLPAELNRPSRMAPGPHDVGRWRGDKPPRVISGGSFGTTWHPNLPRPLSFREQARVIGFPDSWDLTPIEQVSILRCALGKGITVACGEWLGTWLQQSILGEPGSVTGEEIGDDERLIDLTYDFRNVVGPVDRPVRRAVA